jgi:Alpha-L-arabinofuranosidase B (ABFB) domain
MSRPRNFANATLRSALLAFICVATALFVATAAQASCSDRPGTPIMRKPSWNSATSIHLDWLNRASETVWWDLEISDRFGNVLSSQPGIQPIGTRFNQALTMDLRMPLGADQCFRLRARDEPGTEGCVSIQFSTKVCAHDATPGAFVLAGTRITLESFNNIGDFVRHRWFLGEVTAINQFSLVERQDATFIQRKALNGARAVSLESVNFPGWYLRHWGFRLKLEQNDNSQQFANDASFFPVAPLTGFGFSVSFEATNFPGRFIRRDRDFHLVVDPFENNDLFRQDATFFVVPGLER